MKTFFKPWLLYNLFFLGIFHLSNGQTVDFKWGKSYKYPSTTTDFKMYSGDENGVLILRTEKKSEFHSKQLYLDYYDYNKTEIQSHEIVLKKNQSFYDLRRTSSGIILFKLERNKETKARTLIGQLFSNSGKPISEEKKLFIASENRNKNDVFEIRQSNDLSKLLITDDFSKRTFTKLGTSSGETIPVKVIDQNMDLVWEDEIKYHHETDSLFLLTMLVDSDGDLTLLGIVRNESQGKPELWLSFYDHIAEDWHETNFKFEHPISAIRYSLLYDDNLNEVIFTGIYCKDSESEPSGYFYANVDYSNMEVKQLRQSKFSNEFVVKTYYPPTSHPRDSELTTINSYTRIKQFVRKPEGGIILIAEIESIYIGTAEDRANQGFFINMLILDFNKDGTLNYSDVVHKYQRFKNEGINHGSFMAFYEQNKLHFLYNDHPDNRSPKTKPKKIGTLTATDHKKSMLTLAIAEKGKGITYTQLPSFNTTDNLKFIPAYIRLSDDKFVVQAQQGNEFKFGILTIGK